MEPGLRLAMFSNPQPIPVGLARKLRMPFGKKRNGSGEPLRTILLQCLDNR